MASFMWQGLKVYIGEDDNASVATSTSAQIESRIDRWRQLVAAYDADPAADLDSRERIDFMRRRIAEHDNMFSRGAR